MRIPAEGEGMAKQVSGDPSSRYWTLWTFFPGTSVRRFVLLDVALVMSRLWIPIKCDGADFGPQLRSSRHSSCNESPVDSD